MASYFLIQTIEGFVIAPLIQKGSVNVAPAWTLFAIVLFGAVRRHGCGPGGALAGRRPHRRLALLRRGFAA
jgi:predicted PurR-regulated permease PerM